jgi:hypothetical protein
MNMKDKGKNMTHTICPPIGNVKTPSDIECFEMFNIEIDDEGTDLWSIRKNYFAPDGSQALIGERANAVRQEGDTFSGEPGSEERIEALAAYYESRRVPTKDWFEEDERSPFED